MMKVTHSVANRTAKIYTCMKYVYTRKLYTYMYIMDSDPYKIIYIMYTAATDQLSQEELRGRL